MNQPAPENVDPPPAPEAGSGARFNRSFGPILAGIVIDLVDFATFGPVGLVAGLPIGGLAGYWMAQALDLPRRARWWCALAAGIYCTIPFTEFIPLATLVAAYSQFRNSAPPKPPAAA
jgi:hypothetical protein